LVTFTSMSVATIAMTTVRERNIPGWHEAARRHVERLRA
jgi:hypothetical protein